MLKTLCLLLTGLTAIAQPGLGQYTPSLVLKFTGGSLPTGVSFARNSNATRYNAAGQLETVGPNTARITYHPVTKVCQGLLLEETRTNLLTNSGNFSDWATNSVNLTTGAITAPDGTTSGVQLSENSSNDYHYAYRPVSINSSNAYTYSIYAKAGTRSIISIQLEFAGDGYAGANIDLNIGTVGRLLGGATADQITVTPVGEGWYRCSFVSANNTHGGDRVLISIRPESTQDAAYQGDNSYLYIWGGQLEQGGFMTSYIPTGSNTATRAAEVYSVPVTLADGSRWYNPIEGAFLCCFATDVAGVDLRPLVAWDGTNNNRFVVQRNSSNQLGGFGVSGGTTITLGSLAGQQTGQMLAGFTYRGSNEYRLSVNNTLLAVPANSVNAPAITTLTNTPAGRFILQEIIYFPHRQHDSYLQYRTKP